MEVIAPLCGFKKRISSVEGQHQRFFSSKASMEWRPGAGNGKRKKISREFTGLSPCVAMQLSSSHGPHFLRTLHSNALRTMSADNRNARDRILRSWSRLQVVPTVLNQAELDRIPELEYLESPGFSQEKMRLLNEIEALIDSEENALNMEASAKAAEGRLRSLLDVCVCNQCQENLENRIALHKTVRSKAIEDEKMLSTRTNACTLGREEESKHPETTELKKQGNKSNFFLSNVTEAMERDRVALDEFLQKQKLKHDVSRKELEEVKMNFKAFFGKYLGYLNNSVPAMEQREEPREAVKMEKNSDYILKEQVEPPNVKPGRTRQQLSAQDVLVDSDASKLHQTINKLLDKNKQLQEMLCGRENAGDEMLRKLDLSCRTSNGWEFKTPRILNYSRTYTSRIRDGVSSADVENDGTAGDVCAHGGGLSEPSGFPQGYSYLYVSPAFEDENTDPTSHSHLRSCSTEDTGVQICFTQSQEIRQKVQRAKRELFATQEMIYSQAQNFCPKFKISPAPTLCSTFTQTCDIKDANELQLKKYSENQCQTAPKRREELGTLNQKAANDNSILVDIIRSWRTQALVPRCALLNGTQTAEAGRLLLDKTVVHKVGLFESQVGLLDKALFNLSRVCEEEERKLGKEQLDFQVSYTNLVKTMRALLQTFSLRGSNNTVDSNITGGRNMRRIQLVETPTPEEENVVKDTGVERHQARILALERSLAHKSSKVEQLLEAVRSAELIAGESQEEAERKMWEFGKSLEKIADLEQELAEKSLKMEKMAESLESAKQLAEERHREFERKLQEERCSTSKVFQSGLDTLKEELSVRQETIARLEKALSGKDFRIKFLEAKNSEEERTIWMLNEDIENLRQELSSHEAKVLKMEGAVARLKTMECAQSLLENSQHMLTRQLEDARNSLKEMVQILGTERMNNVERSKVLEDALAAKDTVIQELEVKVQELAKEKAKKATDDTERLQTTLNAVKMDLSRVHDKALALEESLARKDAEVRQVECEALQLQDRVVALEFENFELKGRARDLEKQSSEHKRQFDELITINEELLQFAQGKENELNSSSTKMNDMEQTLQKKNQECSFLLKEIEKLQTNSGQTVMKEKYRGLKQTLAGTECEIRQREEAIESLTKRLAAAVETEDALLQEAEQLNLLLKASQFKEHELKDQLSQLRADKQGLEDTVRGLERKLVLVRVEIAELHAQNSGLRKSSENKDKEIAQIRKELEQARAKGQVLEEDLLEKEGQIAILKESFSDDSWLKGET